MIRTPRLILRLPEAADRPALYAMWADPEVMADLGPVKDAAASDAVLAKHDSYRREGLGFWTVERAGDGAVVGFCGLKRGDMHNPIAGEVEAGWIIARPYWRQGYAHEAMAAALDWGWANTSERRIVAITAAANLKSQALMEKLGMSRVPGGDYEHPLFPVGDRLKSTVTYAIARPA
ncbi:GNAT family N-acetyltransferase [Sphingomonas sp.]|uniref:GNAT family N-acetyltransferase n=1 Tax=Sphingomonas sp. TaxID=28214 RepID=UPI001B08F079|nr:GNAT family N-acetyltransferase [Sphingomonas sp.]MBO9713763.1 GNAT family N-acetyltransferase [Sphingomonas sp.]